MKTCEFISRLTSLCGKNILIYVFIPQFFEEYEKVRGIFKDLGYEISEVSNGKVTYIGDVEAIALSNIWLRSADRVYIKMGSLKLKL